MNNPEGIFHQCHFVLGGYSPDDLVIGVSCVDRKTNHLWLSLSDFSVPEQRIQQRKPLGYSASKLPIKVRLSWQSSHTVSNQKLRPFFTGGNGALDLDIISSHLKRTIQDLQEMTLRYDHVLKDKQELIKNLDKTEMDLEAKNKRVDELERLKSDTNERLMEAHGIAKKAGEGAAHQFSSLQRDVNERNTFIIALQMKLLASQEEIDSLKQQLGETTIHRDELLSKLKEISRDYDHQRRESMKLSEKLASQKNNIEKAEGMKLRIRELQFSVQQLSAEKDDALNELNLLKDWTEALKARYDIIEEERKQTQHSHETVVADCSELRDQINGLEIKLIITKREKEDLDKRNSDFMQACNTYKEQRDLYANALKEAIVELDQAKRERDGAIQRHTEVLNTRDQIINKQMDHNKHFETRYEKAVAELHTTKEKLAKTELEVEDLKRVQVDRVSNDDDRSVSFVEVTISGQVINQCG